MRFALTLALCGAGLVVVGSSAAVPKPPPKYWSPARCERAMLDRPLAPPGQVVCVGTGDRRGAAGRAGIGRACTRSSRCSCVIGTRTSKVSDPTTELFARSRSPLAPAHASTGSSPIGETSTRGGPRTSSSAMSRCSQPIRRLRSFAPSSRRSRLISRNTRTRPTAWADSSGWLDLVGPCKCRKDSRHLGRFAM